MYSLHTLEKMSGSLSFFAEGSSQQNGALETIRDVVVFGNHGNKSRSKINCLDVFHFYSNDLQDK